jgi:drug/metabolite transporter (DMT)-like permease
MLAVSLALGSTSFVVALNHTSVAQVMLIQALSPVFAALVSRGLLQEPITRASLVAMALALVGVGFTLKGDASSSVVGSGASLVMSLGFTATIVISRRYRNVSMIPAICLAQILVVILGLFALVIVGSDAPAPSISDLGWLMLFGGVQVGVGFAAFTVATRFVPAVQIALISLLEVVLGPALVWVAFDERPAPASAVGGVVVLIAVIIQITVDRPRTAPAPSR